MTEALPSGSVGTRSGAPEPDAGPFERYRALQRWLFGASEVMTLIEGYREFTGDDDPEDFGEFRRMFGRMEINGATLVLAAAGWVCWILATVSLLTGSAGAWPLAGLLVLLSSVAVVPVTRTPVLVLFTVVVLLHGAWISAVLWTSALVVQFVWARFHVESILLHAGIRRTTRSVLLTGSRPIGPRADVR